MKKVVVMSALALAMVFATVAAVKAADDKKLTGKITCAKCDLGKSKTCATVIVVKEDGKDVVYWFDKDSNKKYHDDICKGGKEGTVEGSVEEKDKKKIISVKKLDYK